MGESDVLRVAIDTARQVSADDLDEQSLTDELVRLFRADSGVGLTFHESGSQQPGLRATVSGPPPLTFEQGRRAAQYAATHPGFLGMRRVGTSEAVRLSNEVQLRRFWGTDSYEAMHGFCEGRFPASALLHIDRSRLIFIALHRRSGDFTDDELLWLTRLQQPIAAAYRYRSALDRAADRVSALYASDDDPNNVMKPWWSGQAPTRREAEVLALMAAGWTNFQIATRLHITERTVRKHLSAVYDKANLPGRAAAATWWIRHREDFTEP